MSEFLRNLNLPHSVFFRPQGELLGKALSAHTIAAFIAAQGVYQFEKLTSGKAMRRDLLEFLLRKRAIDYWTGNHWLLAGKKTTELLLTDSGLRKLESRVKGRARAQSVTSTQVHQALTTIFEGSEHDPMNKFEVEVSAPDRAPPQFFAVKNSGQHKGMFLYPHRYADGSYVATTSKYATDYIYIEHLDDLSALVRSGYGARMSNPDLKQGPSYIAHSKIKFSRTDNSSEVLRRYLSALAGHDDFDGVTLTKYRKEQAFLRAYLLDGRNQAACVLCGRIMPQELLVAAHIKPRSKASKSERLDFENIAALMCSLGCDSLFEKGFVYVAEGKIYINPTRKSTPHLNKSVETLVNRTAENWHGSSEYYKWHAKAFGWKTQ
ncbi:hypothetical protein [Pseudomonas sp. HY2-MNA-CIBAN-0224]|uniref:hypothetical protein n=1 Tax=Pseudomonas sp. HY2-MNA-CIBAN-0224 TaxID=3140471 RepID=UPI0033206BFE